MRPMKGTLSSVKVGGGRSGEGGMHMHMHMHRHGEADEWEAGREKKEATRESGPRPPFAPSLSRTTNDQSACVYL